MSTTIFYVRKLSDISAQEFLGPIKPLVIFSENTFFKQAEGMFGSICLIMVTAPMQ